MPKEDVMTSTLDEIQERADAATNGPWRIENDSECDYEQGIDYAEWPQTLVGPETTHLSAWSKKHGNPHRVDEINELTFPDAEFIAHAREDVPRLVAALRAVEAVVSERYKLWAAICGETCGKEVYGIDHDAIADSIAAAIETAIKDALGS